MKSKSYRLSLVAILAMVAGFAPAAEWWGNTGTGNWNVDANWQGGSVPPSSENAYVNNGGTAVVTNSQTVNTVNPGYSTTTGGTGATGIGTVQVNSNGALSSVGSTTLARNAGTAGTLAVDGGTFNSGNHIYSALSGAGTAIINAVNGGSITAANRFYMNYAGGTATVNVNSGGSIVAGDNGYLGYNGGSGTLNVDGAGSTFTINNGYLIAGRAGGGSGAINITDGGVVDIGEAVYIGHTTGTTGTALVDGSGSKFTSGGRLYAGNNGAGTLTITDGGFVSAVDMTIDTNTNGLGVVQIGLDGILAVGDSDTTATTLTAFLGLIEGTDNIDYWNGSAWAAITSGTLGSDYTLTEYDDGATSYTALTVIPESATLGLLGSVGAFMFFVRRLLI